MNASVSLQDLLRANMPREQIEHWCRQQARSVPVGHDVILNRVLGKYLLYSLSHDSALTPHLAMDGIWEPWVTMAIASHVNPGMRCLDVGACYGYYSVLLADLVGSSGAVTAYEPVAETFDLLVSNLSLNGLLQRCDLRRAAVGARHQGTIRPAPANALGLRNIGGTQVKPWDPVKNESGPFVTFEIPKVTFDFIKIDVEGSEADVWNATLGATHDSTVVCMEFTPKMHTYPRAFLRTVQIDGFVLHTVGHDGVPCPISEDDALVPDTGDFRTLWLTRLPH